MDTSMTVQAAWRKRSRAMTRSLRALACLASCAFATHAHAQCDDVFGYGFEDTAAPAAPIQGSATLQTSDGATHTWFYRIPATPSPPRGRPVLMWLHGDGGNGSGLASAFRPFTDPDGAIIVTPSGINQTWTHAAADLPGRPQDAQAISRILDTLVTDGLAGQRVDPRRIYVGGESRGAYMPYYLLQRPSTKARFAAVAINAGLLYCQSGDTDCVASGSQAVNHGAATPILHLHGTNDTAVAPPPTATFNTPVNWDVDWRVFYPMKLWATQNGCFGGDNSTGRDSGVLRETYAVGAATARRYDLTGWSPACEKYQLILVENGGHVIGGQQQRIWGFLGGRCR